MQGNHFLQSMDSLGALNSLNMQQEATIDRIPEYLHQFWKGRRYSPKQCELDFQEQIRVLKSLLRRALVRTQAMFSKHSSELQEWDIFRIEKVVNYILSQHQYARSYQQHHMVLSYLQALLQQETECRVCVESHQHHEFHRVIEKALPTVLTSLSKHPQKSEDQVFCQFYMQTLDLSKVAESMDKYQQKETWTKRKAERHLLALLKCSLLKLFEKSTGRKLMPRKYDEMMGLGVQCLKRVRSAADEEIHKSLLSFFLQRCPSMDMIMQTTQMVVQYFQSEPQGSETKKITRKGPIKRSGRLAKQQ